MKPCGHLGSGLLFTQAVALIFNYSYDPRNEWILWGASLLPDVVDKPLHWVFHVKATRSYAHTLLFLFLTSYLCHLLFPHEWMVLTFLGILSHLLADLFFGFVPLFWPLQSFRYPSMIYTKTTLRLLRYAEIFGLLYFLLCAPVSEYLRWFITIL
jgi:hypothetical protein